MHLRDVDYYYDQWSNCSTTELESTNTAAPSKRARAMARIQQNLIAAQELGDEKLQVVTQLQEMIDQKTRQLDADFKNLEYADKDDPALVDSSPKDTHPASPSAYIPTSSNAQRSDDGSVAGSSGTSSSINNERPSGSSLPHSGGNANASSSHNADRNAKRSRRAREVAARGANNTNPFPNISKTSQIDMASDSNNSNSNQSNKNASSSGQQLNIGSSSNPNRKQGNNNGGNNNNNNNKKRKRKSARSNNGGNGKFRCFNFLQFSIKISRFK